MLVEKIMREENISHTSESMTEDIYTLTNYLG